MIVLWGLSSALITATAEGQDDMEAWQQGAFGDSAGRIRDQ
jgi:hypothetical protein